MMTEPDWESIKRIVADALELAPAERARFVDDACASDPALRGAVSELLRGSDDDFGDFLEVGFTPRFDAPIQPAPRDLTGSTIGGYRIVRTIASGGMGTVFEAMQDHPRRRVAIKILRGSLHMHDARRRFEREVEVLGRLVHTSIARIYDAGMHRDEHGAEHPYLVMEFIDGADLIRATSDATLDQKLELLARVCDGVQFAHAHGVVHRDLKPANILVVEQVSPRILDFGIARLIDAESQATQQTEVGQILGTLSYMSPEQLSGDPARIDFRTDVYSLGVLLHELVTGRVVNELHGQPIAVAARRITESDPVLPREVSRVYGGDLARILTMALEREPARRYQSPGELGADLRRLLRHEPIHARQHSTLYHLAKFGRRHRALVAAVAVVLLALVGGVIVASLGLVRAATARDEAEAVNTFLQRLLAAVSPEELGRDVEVRVLLDLYADSIDNEFSDRPHVRARLHQTIGESYRSLGRPDEAVSHLQRSFELVRESEGPDHRATLTIQHSLAQALLDADRIDEADRAIAPTLARHDLAQRSDWLYFNALGLDGSSRQARGDLDGAMRQLGLAATGLARTAGEADPHTLTALNNLAGAALAAGDGARAIELLQHLITARRVELPSDHPRVLVAEQNLAVALLQQERAVDALRLLEPIVVSGARVWGPEHPLQLTAEHNLAEAMTRTGNSDAGLVLMQRVATDRERICGPNHEDTLVSLSTIAAEWMQRGDFAAAEPVLAKVLDAFAANGRARGPEALVTRSNRAAALAKLGRAEAARDEHLAVLELCIELAGPDHPQTLATRNNFACLLRDLGDLDAACQMFGENLRLADAAQPESPNNSIHFAFNYGRCLVTLGRFADAERHLLRAESAAREQVSLRDPTIYRAELARCYELWGRESDAERYR